MEEEKCPRRERPLLGEEHGLPLNVPFYLLQR